ncbi:MAG TPA: OmpA family protein [Rhizomicrobium sp.]|jgi:outer membrane protein OmpA-like peptidoglycan-associated protein|nr:OmpA family protein [Rhizomicrobium sp.]
MTRTLVRLTAVLVFALGTSACSTLDSAYNDVLGDDTPAAPTADSSGFPADTAPPAATADASAPTTPDLASVPDKPSGTTSPDAQREVADSLAADRARAAYSSDALRGGTEAAAPPPGPAGAAPDTTAVADNTSPPQPAAAPPPSDTPAPSDAGAPPPSVAGAPPPPDNTPPDNTPPPPAPTTPVAAMPAPPLPSGSQPAVPANGGIPGAQPTVMADSQLGFKPSTAPPLDSSISQFVAQPIIARYQQTAANGGVATGPIAPLDGGEASARAVPLHNRGRAMGGPEVMTGSVVANFDAINNGGSGTPSVYANASGMPPTAVVMFPGDGIAISAAGRAQIRAAVTAFQQRGGAGFIKVVGHSSSRTSNMPVEKHLVAIFAKSQARANAVAREIIREGVPASRVLVEAVGDSQPVYYESMPQGEDGNRRAEIFIQG